MNADTPATRSLTAGAIAHRPLALGLAVLLLGSAAVESHADEERRFHVRPFVGYAMPDKVTTEDEVGIVTADIATEDSASFGISIGTEMFLDHLLWEVEYAHRKADVDGSSFLDVPAGIPLFGGDALTLPTTVKGDGFTGALTTARFTPTRRPPASARTSLMWKSERSHWGRESRSDQLA